MRSRATHAVDGAKVRSHIAALATACLLNLTGAVQADLAPAQQSLVDGKIARDSADLFYTIVGTSGDYVLVLSGGPGEDIRSMQGIADELGKKYRCIMWEQRGTGRSKLPRYNSSMINLNAYIEDIEALRKQLHNEKFIVVKLVGNDFGARLCRHAFRRSARSSYDRFGSNHVRIPRHVFRQSIRPTRTMRARSP